MGWQGMRKDPTKDVETINLENLTIGVFAIVMTLLVLDIKAPDVMLSELPSALISLWPNLLSYAISFALLGIYFLGYTTQFRSIEKADHNSHWISFLFLALVTLIPFSTALLSKNPYSTLPIIIYSSNLAFIGLALYWHWINALGHGLITEDVSSDLIKYAKLRCLVAPAGYIVAIIVAFISPVVSLVICAIVPLLYIIPGMQRLFWMPLAGD
jgi:uncharacterized membrane protein